VNMSRADSVNLAAPGALIRRLAGDTAKILGVLVALRRAMHFWQPGVFGADSHAYWLVWRRAMYTTGPMTHDAYLYSPAFAQAMRPFTLLQWPVFAVLWSILLGLVLAWLLAPLRWWALPLWLAGIPEIISGNIFILLAVVAVLGLRHRWIWAFAALTKITVCLGPVWFAMRREWRQLGISLGVTSGVALLSWMFAPHLWVQWIPFLVSQATESGHQLGEAFWPPLIYRLPVGLILVAWGAKADRRWVLPVGMVLASPVLWLGTFTMLAALPRLQNRPTVRQTSNMVPAT